VFTENPIPGTECPFRKSNDEGRASNYSRAPELPASTIVSSGSGDKRRKKMRQIIMLGAVFSALALSAPIATAAGTGKFCLKGPGMKDNCTFQTMAACAKAKKGTETCVANSSSTTGSGTTSTKPMKK
jgi:Protein of unknown function (DUF3551)